MTNMYWMFCCCYSLTSLDVSGFDTSSVTNMREMFGYCYFLTSLDVSGFDTSNVTNMMAMFSGCSSLASLDPSSFDTSNVTNMYFMFSGCSSLTSLDLSSFDTSKVTEMGYMFNSMKSSCIVGCRNADEVTKLSTSSGHSIPAANFKVGKPVTTALSLADEGVPALSEASAIQPGGADVTDSDAPQSSEATDPEGQGDTTDSSLDPSTETSPGTTDEGVDVSLETLVTPNQAHADETDASVLALGNGVEKGAVAKGDEIDYSLSVAYSGSTDTKSGVLVVTDVLPNHLSYVEGSASIADTGFETQFASEPTYDETTNTLTFSLTAIPAGSQVDVTFKALVVDDATSLGQTLIEYVNQASVTCNATTTLSNAVRHYSGSRSASTHLVTYSYSGDIPGAASSLPSTLSYSPRAEVALAPDVSVFGYTFSGWQVTGATLSSSVFTMPDSDVTITGTWTKDPQYTLTYEWAGLRSADDLPNNLPQMPVVTLTKGLDAPAPAYPVVGATQDSASENDPFASFYKDYEFMGWSSSAATTSTTQASLREVIQGDTITTGSWQRRASDDPVVDPTDSNTSTDDTSASDTSATTTSKTADTTGILIGLISLVMAVSATGATLAWRRRGLRE